MKQPIDKIQEAHDNIKDEFWNYNSQFEYDNVGKISKVLTPEAKKKLNKLKEAIKAIEE